MYSNIHTIKSSDEKIWQELKKGHKAALEQLFHRYYQELYRYGVKLIAEPVEVEDEIQGLFLKIWTHRQHLGDVRGVKTYLWTALRRRLIDKKRNKTRRKRILKNRDEHKTMRFSAEELLIRHEELYEQAQALKQAINRLPPAHREILYLKYYEGMSYEEIQHIMGISYQTARNYIYETLEDLRGYLGETPMGRALAATGYFGVIYLLHLLLGMG